jgi:hypothetical protein
VLFGFRFDSPVPSTKPFLTTMVQGNTKGLKNKTSSARHSARAAANMKKGKKYIAPKKPILMKQASMQKVA